MNGFTSAPIANVISNKMMPNIFFIFVFPNVYLFIFTRVDFTLPIKPVSKTNFAILLFKFVLNIIKTRCLCKHRVSELPLS